MIVVQRCFLFYTGERETRGHDGREWGRHVYTMMNAHTVTVLLVVATVLATPFYLLAAYLFSGASPRKGLLIGAVFLVWGAFAVWMCLAQTVDKLGLPGNLVIPVSWIAPSLILYLRREWFLNEPLSQRWLVGLQIFRAVGGVFLIEMARGHIPGSFAYPAGVGDIVVSLVALAVLVSARPGTPFSTRAVYGVAIIGIADFVSAFFFAFTSSSGPQQLFALGFDNQLGRFPTGMIPLFLVPYAIFFHTLSVLSFRKFECRDRRNGLHS